ncbi:MAG: HXXEE domain-containing protein [Solirubrobacterales bacterium]|nr:HXXEE domain-containing protein [Solirubrobacterales bacterium]OJU93555.1 MAG: hypothetical protein BGO23_12975 [Solirubrobacterales bacterium 67-14]
MGSLPETHGRWPLVGAAALAPVTVAALSTPSLRPLAALLAHQTEEWVRPGGFLPWINREVLGSGDDEFPIDRRSGFLINVGFGWLLSASVLAGPGAAAPQAMLYASHIGNAGLHVGWAIKHRRYDPGLVTGALALLPVGLTGLRRLFKDPAADPVHTGAGLVAGVVFAAGMAPFFKRRLKRST